MKANTYHRAPDQPAPRPSGCPIDPTWSPLNDDYLADPYPIAARLREDHPVFFADQIGHLVVTRMDDIESVFTHPDTFASTNVQDPLFPLAPEASAVLAAADFDPIAVMSNRPEPDHGRIRVYTRQGFSNRRLRALEDHVRARAGEMIEAMVATCPPAEYVQALAFPLPAETVFRLIGFPPQDDSMIKAWCTTRKEFSWGQPTAERQVAIARGMLDYWRYCREFVAERRRNRADDFCSELLDAFESDSTADSGISYHEVESVVYGISFAGHDPVTALLSNTLRCLLPRRDQWNALVADPALAANAVEETLRFESSQVAWRRIATEDTTIRGVAVPAGTRILLNFATANRQPEVFADPNEFDIHRADATRHISFGKGIHYCLGAGLARMETRVVLELLAERLPSLRLVDGQDLTYFPNITFRGPDRLLVEWDG